MQVIKLNKGEKIVAKQSTVIKKVDTNLTEFKSDGILLVDDMGYLVIETDDYGRFDLINVANELKLLGQVVRVQLTLKNEDAEEISPLEVIGEE